MVETPGGETATIQIPSGGRAVGSLLPPASKSLTQRFFNLALLARTPSLIQRPLFAADTQSFLAGLAALGCAVERRRGGVRIVPPGCPGEAAIDCGAGGTMLRFVVAAACVVPGTWTVDGSARLRERPLAPLVQALERLGGRIDYLGSAGHAPVRISGGGLRGGIVEIDAGESSQFLSALLMAAARAEGVVEIGVRRLVSAPYVELTLATMAEFGIAVERPGEGRFVVRPAPFPGREVAIEADASAACYAAAAAALTGGRVTILGLRPDSRQGDLGFFELLRGMGARVDWRGTRLEIAGGGRLRAVAADLSEMPDQVPTLAALAPFAEGTTRIENVAHLRLKESDRLQAMSRELRRLGAAVDERPDGLVVPGVWASRPVPSDAVVVDSHDDHRIAMSLALVGLRRPGVSIAAPAVVAKSYPGFWRDLRRLVEA